MAMDTPSMALDRAAQVAHILWEAMRLTGEMFGVSGPPWEAITAGAREAAAQVVASFADGGHPTASAPALHQVWCRSLPPDVLVPGEGEVVFAYLPGFRRAQYDAAAALLGALAGTR